VKPSYRADIDGLRALAVLPVILFHAGVPQLSGGFVGVDIFFVISGFLITTIIAGEIEARKFSILGFYERRIRRILPNLFVMMIAATIAALILLIPSDLAFYGQSLFATTLSASNIYFFLKTGYFDLNALQLPLLHTWSLGVEEQYYIFFPPLMMLFARFGGRRIQPAIWALFAFSLAFSVFQVRYSPNGAFYLPFGRWWELMVGSLLAIGAIPSLPSHRSREIVALAGLTAILASIALFSEHMYFPGESALLPTLGTAAIIHANGRGPTLIGRMLSWRPLVFIGLISYSLYLWHWPLLVFPRYLAQRALTTPEMIAALIAIALVSIAAWYWVERPLRRARGAGNRRALFMLTAAAMAVFCVAGLILWRTQGLPGRYTPQVQALAAGALDVNPLRAGCDRRSPAEVAAGKLCRIGARRAPVSFAFVGDSFADAMVPAVAASAERTGTAGVIVTLPGCMPLAGVGPCGVYWRMVLKSLRDRGDIRTVIITSRWPSFVEASRFGLFAAAIPLQLDEFSREPSIAESRLAIERGFGRTARLLAPKRLVVLAYMPEQKVHVPQTLVLHSRLGGSLHGIARSEMEQRQAHTRRIISAAARRDGFDVIDASRLMCNARECPILRDGHALYADDSHPTRTAAIGLSPMFDATLIESRR